MSLESQLDELMGNNRLLEAGQICVNIVTNIDPNNFTAWLYLARIHYAYGEYVKAHADLDMAVNVNDNHTQQWKYNMTNNLRSLIYQKWGGKSQVTNNDGNGTGGKSQPVDWVGVTQNEMDDTSGINW